MTAPRWCIGRWVSVTDSFWPVQSIDAMRLERQRRHLSHGFPSGFFNTNVRFNGTYSERPAFKALLQTDWTRGSRVPYLKICRVWDWTHAHPIKCEHSTDGSRVLLSLSWHYRSFLYSSAGATRDWPGWICVGATFGFCGVMCWEWGCSSSSSSSLSLNTSSWYLKMSLCT